MQRKLLIVYYYLLFIIWLKIASSICSIKITRELTDLINIYSINRWEKMIHISSNTYFINRWKKNDLEVLFH